MKFFRVLFPVVGLMISGCGEKCLYDTGADPVQYVNTLTGTASTYEFSSGNTYPAVAVPWGMNFWTPQTGKMGDGWTYVYFSDKIRGFKQTHQPSPWINDYGQFSVMPVTGGLKFDENQRASLFSHKAEDAKPYYYGVYLADHDIYAEMTATSRAAAFTFTYPESDSSYFVIDAFDKGSYVKIIPEQNKIIGFTTKNSGGVPDNFKNWFVIYSDTPFAFYNTVSDGILSSASEAQSNHAMAVAGFKTRKGQKVTLKIASSFISLQQAEQNLKEIGDKTFEEIVNSSRLEWNNVLGRIKIEDDDKDNIKTFYSCLYRSVLFPRSFYEIAENGEILHYSPYDGSVRQGYLFTDTGFWDTFRALFPLVNLLYPEMSSKMQQGLVNTYEESGFLPEWASPGHRNCMVGNNSASVVADAFVSGITGYNPEKLWEAVIKGANSVHPHVSSTGRKGWLYYNVLGYVPCDVGINESAARTLEYCYDDWCIYVFGKALGKSEHELQQYKKAAFNYKNLFNAEYNLMSGKRQDGQFEQPFSPFKWGGSFTEGNSLHYTWSVFHDIAGLKKLMGGDKNFIAMMDTVFLLPPIFDDSYYGFPIHEIREMQVMNMGNYAHGNQPVQHLLYLYDWSSQPWKGQAKIREVMNKFYKAVPDGYCGDEDNGQTSAWYVFSALGFYPVCPASGQYAIGSPLFKKAVLKIGDKTFEIKAENNSSSTPYVDKIKLNGKIHKFNFITVETLKKGGKMKFTMSDFPNKKRGSDEAFHPYSFSNEK